LLIDHGEAVVLAVRAVAAHRVTRTIVAAYVGACCGVLMADVLLGSRAGRLLDATLIMGVVLLVVSLTYAVGPFVLLPPVGAVAFASALTLMIAVADKAAVFSFIGASAALAIAFVVRLERALPAELRDNGRPRKARTERRAFP
jgi:hypothetical protein